MNEIIQKRIEEVTIFLFKQRGLDKESCKQAMDYILANQWISVEEALPEEDIPNCFVSYRAMDMILYSTGSYEKDNKEWYVDGVGFNAEVTHWMFIPELPKGGEKCI